jgi:hypothetical protein
VARNYGLRSLSTKRSASPTRLYELILDAGTLELLSEISISRFSDIGVTGKPWPGPKLLLLVIPKAWCYFWMIIDLLGEPFVVTDSAGDNTEGLPLRTFPFWLLPGDPNKESSFLAGDLEVFRIGLRGDLLGLGFSLKFTSNSCVIGMSLLARGYRACLARTHLLSNSLCSIWFYLALWTLLSAFLSLSLRKTLIMA